MNRNVIKKYLHQLMSLAIKSKCYHFMEPLYGGLGHILMFHRVCPEGERSTLSKNSYLEITPGALDKTITYFLSRGYGVISLDQLYTTLQENTATQKFVVFTFDDGYLDNLTHAYPIFKKYGLPFTIYVTTSFPDRSAILWWYLLEDLILREAHLTFEFAKDPFHFKCATTREKEDAYAKLRAFILNSHEEEHSAIIHGIFDAYHIDLYQKTEELALSWEQIKRLSEDALVTIGAHTTSHPALNKLNKSEALHEILDSKKEIEHHIQAPVHHFAYPFGTKNEVGQREADIVKRCAFKTATTTRSGNIFADHRSYMDCLPRNLISGDMVQRDIDYLGLWASGVIPCIKNKFKRIVGL